MTDKLKLTKVHIFEIAIVIKPESESPLTMKGENMLNKK